MIAPTQLPPGLPMPRPPARHLARRAAESRGSPWQAACPQPEQLGRSVELRLGGLPTYGLVRLPEPVRDAWNDPIDIYEFLKRTGGVARTAQLLSARYSRTDIERLTARGVTQPRRGIFLTPDCDQDLAAAVRHNAPLTCASAADHYGL